MEEIGGVSRRRRRAVAVAAETGGKLDLESGDSFLLEVSTLGNEQFILLEN
jgi:hypothetical protein